ncbi:MAG: DUF389 domain-containing protein [Deltaproteobacteria bacterium]|jgi:uncharacterized hydrophobic protein (TIGR00271 family)|nr:DUF389 domain-containing protein [Deltaproteobacteria bacterium]
MSLSVSRWFGDWRHHVEKPVSAEEVEPAVERGSIPAYAFYFMLTLSALIATFGLLANSAAVIIGAMIIAPLMSPIISLSYGIVAGRGALSMRSLLTVVTGTLLTIGVAFAFTEAIGWKLAGSEIVARMRPSLLDLGVAVAAGAAAAFAYTRPGVSSALAGIAIAVALVPPLCTVGIIMALGQEANAEVGLALDRFSARGPFLLYLTNIIGIVFAGSLVFFWRYYRRRLRAMLALALTIASLVIVVPPLGIGMDNLLIRNQVHRSLTVESRELLLAEHDFRFTNLSVRIRQGTVFVRGDIVASPGLFTQKLINALREKLSERVTMPVILEFGIIPETILRSTEEANVDG